LCHLFDNTEYLGKVLLVILAFSETGHLTVTQVRVLIKAKLLPKADKRGLGLAMTANEELERAVLVPHRTIVAQ
jgi:uncharacterized protein YwlG (UPF0340 family)